MDQRLISGDNHIDLTYLPPDVWANPPAKWRLPEFKLVERVIALYERSFVLRARDPDVRFLQLFIVCHGALLSAAATSGRR